MLRRLQVTDLSAAQGSATQEDTPSFPDTPLAPRTVAETRPHMALRFRHKRVLPGPAYFHASAASPTFQRSLEWKTPP